MILFYSCVFGQDAKTRLCYQSAPSASGQEKQTTKQTNTNNPLDHRQSLSLYQPSNEVPSIFIQSENPKPSHSLRNVQLEDVFASQTGYNNTTKKEGTENWTSCIYEAALRSEERDVEAEKSAHSARNEVTVRRPDRSIHCSRASHSAPP